MEQHPVKLEFPNTPRSVLPILKTQLEQFGARVHFQSETRGHVESIAGKLEFEHVGQQLSIWVCEDKGHFTPALLMGGIKQMVSEARELAMAGAV
jgi:hypothetical protein